MNFIYKTIYLFVFCILFLTACSSDSKQGDKASSLSNTQGKEQTEHQKITPENWQPKASQKVIDSLKKNMKRIPNPNKNATAAKTILNETTPDEAIQKAATQYGDAYCKCQNMEVPKESKSVEDGLKKQEKAKCISLVNKAVLKTAIDLKSKGKVFTNTYQSIIKKCQ